VSESPPLRLVDADGVVSDYDAALPKLQRELDQLHDQLAGAEREIRSWRARYAELSRDKEEAVRRDPLWARAERLFARWQILCGHTRAKWDYSRFEVVRPFLKADGYDLCLLAIEGAAYDPYTKPRTNGSVKRFDDWELVFKSRGKFEEFACRAPAAALKAYQAKRELPATDDPKEPHAKA
jgi:hypothetical protein